MPVTSDGHIVGGEAFEEMLSAVNVKKQLKDTVEQVKKTTAVTKRDALVKKIKYLKGLADQGIDNPADKFILRNVPVLPPVMRPPIPQGGNRIVFSDVNNLYKDHILVNNTMKALKEDLPPEALAQQREELYNGLRMIFGLQGATGISPNTRSRPVKGLLQQVTGTTGPKTGVFHSKILNRKQDLSARATIASAPDVGFNEAKVPADMLWTLYEPHGVRDLVKNGYNLAEAKKAWMDKTIAATNSFNKISKEVPIFINRAPTLMKSNIMAVMPIPVEGKTIGINPLHLPGLAGDFDGDAVTVLAPVTPEAIAEAKRNMTPENMIYDNRKGIGHTLYQPGHEAILGSFHLTAPDTEQKVVHFNTEEEVFEALKNGIIKENTPITIGKK